MAVRIFRCVDCGHRMRLGGRVCGLCYGRKTERQLRARWLVPLLGLCMLALILVVAALLAR